MASASSTGSGPSLDARGQRLAVDELEHQEPLAARLLEAVDAGDVRMVQRGEDLRLAPETRETFRILRDAVGQRFQRDLATEPGVLRPVHLAHPAGAEQRRQSHRNPAAFRGRAASSVIISRGG